MVGAFTICSPIGMTRNLPLPSILLDQDTAHANW